MKHYFKNYNIGSFNFFYNLLLLSLFLVTSAYNGIYFVFVWELMSLTSFFLIIFEWQHRDTIRAGLIYFIMTHIATAFVLAAFLMINQSIGSFDFGIIKSSAQSLSLTLQTIVVVCMLIGFGTKAGIIPVHIWLPRAHSAAPSHISALMSGVIIKMGIFMMIRMFFDILPFTPVWLGPVILLLGAVSSVLGVLYALTEHDLKRLLAYHSIENVGIILIGLGSSLFFIQTNNPGLAIMAAGAGFFHTLNHAVFKSLLFLGAGSIINQTHTRNIEEYGGLIKTMPLTAFFFLIGSIAISGLPPFNGFVSEWLTFQSLFSGIATQGLVTKSMFIGVTFALALTGGLAAACFVKAFGITFLARPRSVEAEKAKESSYYLTLSMGFLALLCLLFGIFGGNIISIIQQVVTSLSIFGSGTSALSSVGYSLVVSGGIAVLNIPLLIMAALFAAVITVGFTNWLSRNQKSVRSIIWDCGFNDLTPRMEITATAFSRSLILIFKSILRPAKFQHIEYLNNKKGYFVTNNTINLSIQNLYESYFYRPTAGVFNVLSLQIRRFQSGNINQYLLYLFILLVILLVFAKF